MILYDHLHVINLQLFKNLLYIYTNFITICQIFFAKSVHLQYIYAYDIK